MLSLLLNATRQCKIEFATLAHLTLHAHLPAQFLNNPAHNRQAQPVPFHTLLLKSFERLEHARLFAGC